MLNTKRATLECFAHSVTKSILTLLALFTVICASVVAEAAPVQKKSTLETSLTQQLFVTELSTSLDKDVSSDDGITELNAHIWAEFLDNPFVYPGGSGAFLGTMSSETLIGWRILKPDNTELASSSNAHGWSVNVSIFPEYEIAVNAPSNAAVAVGLKAQIEAPLGLPSPRPYMYAIFDVKDPGTSPPTPPQNLTAQGTNHKVRLEWNPVQLGASYKVKRSLISGSSYVTIANVTDTTFLDNGLTNGTTYYYVVTAVGVAGESAPSLEVSATPVSLGGPLGIPTNPPNGILPNPLALPGWMEHLAPIATASGPSGGSASGTAISLVDGVVIQNNGHDIVGQNPIGADVAFSRTYRSSLAVANISSPGLPAGWTHNWDFRIVAPTQNTWGNLYLLYPNGAWDLLAPQYSNDEPTGQITVPSGAPYVIEGIPDLENEGQWISFTIRGNGLSRQKFTRPAGDNVYRLSEIIDTHNAKLTFLYSGSKLVDVNVFHASQLATTNLLHMNYGGPSGKLNQIYGRNELFTQLAYSGDQISGVYAKNNGGFLWSYSYSSIEDHPFLTGVTTIGPSGNPNSSSIAIDLESGRATGITDSNGVSNTIEYFVGEAQETHSHSAVTSTTSKTLFDNLGRITKVIDDENYQTSIVYAGNSPASILQVTTPNSTQNWEYDFKNNVTRVWSTPDLRSVETTWEYPTDFPHGRITGVVSKNSGGSTDTSTQISYYAATSVNEGELKDEIESVTTDGDTVSYKYTARGNVKEITQTGADGLPATTHFEYLTQYAPPESEVLGQPRKIIDPIGRVTLFSYDAQGNLSSTEDPIGRVTNFSYNHYHQLNSVTSSGRQIAFDNFVGGKPPRGVAYDDDTTSGVGPITLQTLQFDNEYSINSISSASQYLTLTKDVDYGLTSATNSNNVKMHQFERQPAFHREITKVGLGARGTIWESQYNPINGLLDSVESTKSRIDYWYTTQNSFLEQEVAVDKTSTLPIYNRTNDYEYDSHGRVYRAFSNAGVHTYTYDSNGNLLVDIFASDIVSTSGTDYSRIEYAWTNQGVLHSMKVTGASGVTVEYTYQYNSIGWLTEITAAYVWASIPEFKANYYYDNAGRVIAVKTPKSTTLYQYNVYDELIRLENLTPDGVITPGTPTQYQVQDSINGSWHTVLSRFSNITYNAFGERTGMEYAFRLQQGSQIYETGTIGYTYSAHRLTGENYTRTGYANISYSHSYDSADNLTTLRGISIPHDNNSDQITGILAFAPNNAVTYDANGGMTKRKDMTFVHDAFEMLAEISKISSGGGTNPQGPVLMEEESAIEAPPPATVLEQSYKYDHDGLRRFTDAGNKHFGYGYDGSNLVVQNVLGEGGNETIHYMWGPTGPVMELSSGGGVLAYGFSPGGDLVARIQGNVNYGNNYDKPRLYGAYGKELWTDEDFFFYQPFRWKGQAGYVSDFKTGLVYCWHRYYDPELGRWLTRDPIGLEGGVNTYAYCNGDPVNYVDPSGLVKITAYWYSIISPGIGLGTHFFLSIEDNDNRSKTFGQIFLISGYAINSETKDVTDGLSYGDLLHAELRFAKGGNGGAYDYPKFAGLSSKFPIQGNLVLQDDLAPFALYYNQAEKAVNAINRANIPYILLGDNSNSVARYMLDSFGLTSVFFKKLKSWEDANDKLRKGKRERNTTPGITGFEFHFPKGGPRPFPKYDPKSPWWIQ